MRHNFPKFHLIQHKTIQTNMSELLYSFPTWDLHNLGSLFSPDFPSAMEESPEQIFRSASMEYSDVSTGYLEDALIEFSERSKRRRLLFYTDDQPKGFDDDLSMKNDWGLSENFCCMSQFAAAASHGILSDEHKSIISDFEAISTSYESPHSSSSSHKISIDEKPSIYPKISADPSSSCHGNNEEKKKKRVVTRIVYPFALVKPGGREDDLTLNDINERILMPPTRPVRHPVGDFACRPCVSADGTAGISGKAVVALTRIHTQGRGTITIIRTKG